MKPADPAAVEPAAAWLLVRLAGEAAPWLTLRREGALKGWLSDTLRRAAKSVGCEISPGMTAFGPRLLVHPPKPAEPKPSRSISPPPQAAAVLHEVLTRVPPSVSARAFDVAQVMRVPSMLAVGEADRREWAPQSCSLCGAQTDLRWGDTALCAECARKVATSTGWPCPPID